MAVPKDHSLLLDVALFLVLLFLLHTSRRSLQGVLHLGSIVQTAARILKMRMVITHVQYSSGASSVSRTSVRCILFEQCISLDF